MTDKRLHTIIGVTHDEQYQYFKDRGLHINGNKGLILLGYELLIYERNGLKREYESNIKSLYIVTIIFGTILIGLLSFFGNMLITSLMFIILSVFVNFFLYKFKKLDNYKNYKEYNYYVNKHSILSAIQTNKVPLIFSHLMINKKRLDEFILEKKVNQLENKNRYD